MSAMGDQKINKKKARKSFQQKTTRSADYVSVDAELLRSAIAAVSRPGGALRFGYSRDGGVYAIGVMGDGSPYTLWCKDSDEVELTLTGLIEHFDDKRSGEAEEPEAQK